MYRPNVISCYQSFIYSPTDAIVSCLKKQNLQKNFNINLNVNFNILISFLRQLANASVGE